MKIYDLTLPISENLPVWPGDPAPRLTPVSSFAAGDSSAVSALRLGTHTGTHIDAPSHIVPGGLSVDRLPLERLIGAAWVCRIPETARSVDAGTLDCAGIPPGTTRLLLRTSNSEAWGREPLHFSTDYIALEPSGAQWIVDHGIRLVGIDCLSMDPEDSEDLPAHHILLTHAVVVLEALDLRGVPDGLYHLCCLPLRLADADGSPARVVLISDGSC